MKTTNYPRLMTAGGVLVAAGLFVFGVGVAMRDELRLDCSEGRRR